MRDLVRDAAVVTIANQIMNNENAWMPVETFVYSYAASEDARQELRATMSLYGLIGQKYVKGRWELEGRYEWYWSNDLDV